MFGTQELRLIRYSIKQTMKELKKRQSILDPDSDDAIEIINDLTLYSIILEKIADNPEV